MTTEAEVQTPGEHLQAVRKKVNELLDGVQGRKAVDVSYDTRSATWRFMTKDRPEYKTTRLDIEADEVLDIYERLVKGEWVPSYIPPKSAAPSQPYLQPKVIDPNRSFTDRVIDTSKKVASTFARGHVQPVYVEKKAWPDEIIERAKALDMIDKHEIREGGGYRKFSKDTYWFPLDVLVEEEEGNEQIIDDKEFDEFFLDLVEKHGLKKKASVKWEYEDKKDNKGYLSSWWKNDWGFKSGPGSDLAKRLAIALGVINTTIQVVNDNPDVRWRVELATDDNINAPMSYTNFEDKMVVVSPQALLDNSIDEDQQIEITTGYSLHEASHVEYTGELVEQLREPTVLRPIAVAALLMNIIEDQRIERLTAAKFPGFNGYFVTMHGYLWKIGAKMYPDTWGPGLNDKLNAIIAMVKWPVPYRTKLGANMTPDFEAEFEWFGTWSDDYIHDRVGLRESLEKALAHLAEDPTTKQEMKQQQQSEEDGEKMRKQMLDTLNSEGFKKAVQQAVDEMKEQARKNGKPEVQQSCPSPNQPNGKPQQIDQMTADQIDQFIREEIRVEDVPLPARFPDQRRGREPKMEITKPEIELNAQPPVSPMLARLKNAFVFRKARPMYSTRQLKSGTIDEEMLANIAYGDFRVFEQRVIESDPDTQVTMLIDCSGSMSGTNLNIASELAHVMLACLKTMKGVRVRVRAHTSETEAHHYVSGVGTSQVFRVWEPGDDLRRVYEMKQLPSASNYDGFAIAWCAEEMLKEQRPGEDMVLIVLSDGRPAGGGYAGLPAMQHVRQVTDAYEKKGVTSIQIAVDPAVGPGDQSVMFKHFISYESREKLPTQLTNMLIKLFS